jgi:hypothetical protein
MKVYLAPDGADDFVLPVSKKELRWLPAVRGALSMADAAFHFHQGRAGPHMTCFGSNLDPTPWPIRRPLRNLNRSPISAANRSISNVFRRRTCDD